MYGTGNFASCFACWPSFVVVVVIVVVVVVGGGGGGGGVNGVKVESLALSPLTHSTAGTVNILYSLCLSLYRVILEEVSVCWEVIVPVMRKKNI